MTVYAIAVGASAESLRRYLAVNDPPEEPQVGWRLRNSRMLAKGRPTHFLAMPGGTGTADMTRKALAAGLWPA